MPPDTAIVRSNTSSRFITVHVLSKEPSPEAFESTIKQHLARVPLHAEHGLYAPAAIVSVQGLSASRAADTKTGTIEAIAKATRYWEEEF
ncbi:hypothetical protein D3C72_2038610 [compost metagenome]